MNKNIGMLDYFSVLVFGENPDEQMIKYDALQDVSKPYVIYKYKDKNKLRKDKIEIYNGLLTKLKSVKDVETIKKIILELKNQSDDDYYSKLASLHAYDSEKNIISTENPNAQWLSCEKGGKIFSNYMKDFNDNGVISSLKKDVDWKLTHMREDKIQLYNRTWELCVDNDTPKTDKDVTIKNNMRNYQAYFNRYKNKEQYVKVSTSFWTYAVVYNGVWIDMDNTNEFDWITNFYDTFIKKEPNNQLLTIYECTK